MNKVNVDAPSRRSLWDMNEMKHAGPRITTATKIHMKAMKGKYIIHHGREKMCSKWHMGSCIKETHTQKQIMVACIIGCAVLWDINTKIDH